MNNFWCTNYSSVRTNTRFTVMANEKLIVFRYNLVARVGCAPKL